MGKICDVSQRRLNGKKMAENVETGKWRSKANCTPKRPKIILGTAGKNSKTYEKNIFCQTSTCIPIATTAWGKTFYRQTIVLEIL